jgi:hypothetical protein
MIILISSRILARCRVIRVSLCSTTYVRFSAGIYDCPAVGRFRYTQRSGIETNSRSDPFSPLTVALDEPTTSQ